MTNMDQEREGATTPKTRTPQGGPNVQQEHAHHYDNNKQKMQIHQPQPEQFGITCEKQQSPANTIMPVIQSSSSGKNEKIKLHEVNSYLTCFLCKGYLIDATTISECLHSFCRSCIIKFLEDNSHCPECELVINKAKPNLKLDKTLQDIVYKLVPELYFNEMTRRRQFYGNHPVKTSHLSPEQRGDDTERIIFNARDKFSLSLEYISDDSTPGAILLPSNSYKNESIAINNNNDRESAKETDNVMMRRFLQCPGMCRIDVLKKFVCNKYNVDKTSFHIDILYKRVPLPDHYTLIDIAYIYSWKRNEPMKFFFRITDIKYVRDRFDYYQEQADVEEERIPVPVKRMVLSTPISKPKSSSILATPQVASKKVKSVRFHDGSEPLKSPRAHSTPIKSDNKSKSATTPNGGVAAHKVIKHAAPTHSVKQLSHSDSSSDERVVGVRKQVLKHAKKPRPKHKDIVVASVKHESVTFNSSSTKPEKVPAKNNLTMVLNVATNGNLDRQGADKKPFALGSDSSAEMDKEQFLMSINLQARRSGDQIVNNQNQRNQSTISSSSVSPKSAKVPSKLDKSKPQGVKRKLSSPQRNGSDKEKAEKTKKPKLIKKKPAKMLKNNANSPEPNLKSLLNTCKIPSSLSITCVNGERETQIKPVINHIEILKLPEVVIDGKSAVAEKVVDVVEESQPMDMEKLEKVGTTMKLQSQEETNKEEKKPDAKSELSITITVEKSKEDQKLGVHPNLPKVLASNPVTMRPSTHSFQKMFEDTLKRRNEQAANNKEAAKGNEAVPGNADVVDGKADDKNVSAKRNILEIASKLYKKTKLEHDLQQGNVVTNAEGKVAIPRLKKATNHCETLSNLHSNSLALNYSVSVSQQKPTMDVSSPPKDENVVTSTTKVEAQTSMLPSLQMANMAQSKFQELNVSIKSPRASPKLKPSPEINVSSTIPSPSLPKAKQASPTPHSVIHVPKPLINIKSATAKRASPKPRAPRPHASSPRPVSIAPKLPSPRLMCNIPSMPMGTSALMPPNSAALSPRPAHSPKAPLASPKDKTHQQKLDVNQLQEKYNLQNLAQLSASFNYPSAGGYGQQQQQQQQHTLAAIQQAMLLNLGMQNRPNWFNMNPTNLVQYEKFLQSMGGGAATKTPPNGQNHLLTKEN